MTRLDILITLEESDRSAKELVEAIPGTFLQEVFYEAQCLVTQGQVRSYSVGNVIFFALTDAVRQDIHTLRTVLEKAS